MKPKDDSSLYISADDLQIQYAEIEPMVGYHVGKWLAYVALALLCVYLWANYAAT